MTQREYLTSLPDDRFLAVASLYLGKVDMPFNKTRLIDELAVFFSRDDIRKSIISRCDDEDALLISAVNFLGKATAEQLLVFSKEGRLRTFMRLTSLEKRMLLLKGTDGTYHTADEFDYTPLLNSSFLEKRSDIRDTRLSESITAMLSIINSCHFRTSIPRAERSFNAADGPACFPLLSQKEVSQFFTSLLGAGLNYGFIREDGGYAVISREKCDEFLSLPLAMQAAIITMGGERQSSTLIRRASLISLLALTDSYDLAVSLGLASSKEEIEDFMQSWSFILPYESAETAEKATISADMTLFGRSFAGSGIYLTAAIRKVDVLVTYELTKEAVKAAFDAGHDDMAVLDILSKLGDVPSLISDRVAAWYRSYEEIKVYDTLYVETDERSARVISSLPLLQIHIIRKTGDTGFLFRRKTEEQWRRIMLYAGLEMIGRTRAEDGFSVIETDEEDMRKLPAGLESFSPYTLEGIPEERSEEESHLKENLLRIAINEKIKDKAERDGYLSYLSKGYIVAESQIIKGKQFPRPRSATGFEFQSKLQLLASVQGDESRMVSLTLESGMIEGVVLALDKKAEESSITFEKSEDDKIITIPVASIFLIKTLID